MPHLSHVDQEAVFAALRDLYAETGLGALRELMLRLVSRLVPNDWASYNEIDPQGYRSVRNIRIPDSVEIQRRVSGMLACVHEHPGVTWGNNASYEARTMSDFFSWRDFQRTAMFNEYYRHVGVRHQLFFNFDGGRGTWRGIAINRRHGDFSARDRLVASLLSPHFDQAHTNAVRLERLHQIATVFENPDFTASEIAIGLRVDNRIDALSEPARQWLSRHLGIDLDDGSPPPEAMLQWLRHEDTAAQQPAQLNGPRAPLRLAGPRGEVAVRIATRKPGASTVLFLKVIPASGAISRLELPELTRRENEVLVWIAQGKSNPEIAVILGLSVRTVYKHVENLFAKLGVESRGQAMVRALEER